MRQPVVVARGPRGGGETPRSQAQRRPRPARALPVAGDGQRRGSDLATHASQETCAKHPAHRKLEVKPCAS
jgi:hypothetical protein